MERCEWREVSGERSEHQEGEVSLGIISCLQTVRLLTGLIPSVVPRKLRIHVISNDTCMWHLYTNLSNQGNIKHDLLVSEGDSYT